MPNAATCAQVLAAPKAFGEQESRHLAVQCANQKLQSLTAEQRVEWAIDHLPAQQMLSSSFGAQSAVMLHLITRQLPQIPVVVIDTGYLFPETYRFIDVLTERLQLNLKIYRPHQSAAWQEARHGERWQNGLPGLEAYNYENKVEPMSRALDELEAKTWFAGLRRSQGASRQSLEVLTSAGHGWKVHPIIDWSDRDVYRYLAAHDLPYHPLWHKGYISIGDTHTTRSVYEVDQVEATRFFGLKRECGIHELSFPDDRSN